MLASAQCPIAVAVPILSILAGHAGVRRCPGGVWLPTHFSTAAQVIESAIRHSSTDPKVNLKQIKKLRL